MVHKDHSRLIKQLVGICNDLAHRCGTIQLSQGKLEMWFNGNEGIGKAYDFFVHKVGKWPWKPLVWKSCILPNKVCAMVILTW